VLPKVRRGLSRIPFELHLSSLRRGFRVRPTYLTLSCAAGSAC
jgi:hypothetical protein